MPLKTIKDNFAENLKKYIGKTVTIITQSGGESGLGFTGAVFSVNNHFVRLVTRIGSAPCCFGNNKLSGYYFKKNYIICSCGLGSFADIPIDKITSIIHYSV